MTSKIVVNNIEADAGVSTVTFASEVTAPTFNGNIVGTAATFSGSVGIGTDNPSTKLEVTGDITITNGTQENAIRTNSAGQLQFMRNAAANNSVAMTINDEDGNIGIATANPSDHNNFSRALDINGPSGAAVYMRTDGSSTNTFIVGNYGSEAYLNNVANGNIRFYTQGDERFRITSAGLVGIGTNNPNYLTTIAADGANAKLNIKRKTAAASNGNAFGSLFYTNSDGTDVASIRAHRESANDDAYLGFAARNTGGSITERLRITSAGTLDFKTADGVGINFRESGYINIDSDNNDSNRNFAFYDAKGTGSEKVLMRILDTGKIGIGTDNPDELLEVGDGTVSGALKVSGQSSSVTSDGFTVDWESSSNSTRFFSEPSSGGSSAIRFFTTSSGTRAEKLRITGIGSVGIGHADPNTRLYVKDTGADISNGNAIINSTQKGIRLEVNSNDDKSLGLWFSTGSHHSGMSGQRNDSANTWGTDLRFYTHEDATNDLTYTRERLRINPHGLLINRKGNNAVNTGGTILGRYKYAQQNQGSGVAHLILGADGRKLQDYLDTNCYCIITVCVTGTGTTNMYCQYYYMANSTPNSSSLNHMYGNSGSSSNRPYMNLQNTHDPAWLMSHNGGYILDIEVAVYGGSWGRTATKEYGWFAGNP